MNWALWLSQLWDAWSPSTSTTGLRHWLRVKAVEKARKR